MKQNVKKVLCLLLSVMLLFSVSAINVFAENKPTMKITLRIEGISANMFYKTIEVPYTDTLFLKEALSYIDSQEDSITITGVDTNYITNINGDTSAKFGGWDGWMFHVNGVEASTGIDGCALKDGDNVVLYYGDPYGVGMQYSVADTSKIADGIIKFTSSDTTYDKSYNATVKVNPIVGATVTWNYGNTNTAYTTDANGEIKINTAQLTEGLHIIQLSKANSAGLPLVLRCAPDYSVKVVAAINSQVKDVDSQISNPTQTSDNNNVAIYIVLMSTSVVGVIMTIVKKRKHTYEK